MKTPTKKEIQAEIKALIEIKPHVLATNFFGEDHHAAIDAQVAVLEEEMDEEAIYAKWEDPENYDHQRNVINAAIDAMNWRDGCADYEGESPAKDWEELRKK